MNSQLTLPEWDRLDHHERESLARKIESNIPQLEFQEILTFNYYGLSHNVAFFTSAGMRFALIPGGSNTLGFDPNDWEPSEEERLDWERANGDQGMELTEYMYHNLTRRRQVTIDPFLLQVSQSALGVMLLPPEDPRIDPNLVRQLVPGVGGISKGHRDGSMDYELSEDGILKVTLSRLVNHDDARALVSSDGFRLPTWNEWEYACAGGSRTLFRWGDHCPSGAFSEHAFPHVIQNPFDLLLDEELRSQYLRDRATLHEELLAVHPSIFPNAFGLQMCSSVSDYDEYVSEPQLVRGNNPEELMSTGSSFAGVWLTSAPSFVTRLSQEEVGLPRYKVAFRRALSVPFGGIKGVRNH